MINLIGRTTGSAEPVSAEEQAEVKQKIAFVKAKIKGSIDFYTKARVDNKHKAVRAKLSVTAMSAVISIAAGIALSFDAATFWPDAINILVLVLGGVSTVVGTWDNFYDHKDLWVRYTDYFMKLIHLQSQLEYLELSPTTKLADVDKVMGAYLKILDDSRVEWTKIRTADEEKQKEQIEQMLEKVAGQWASRQEGMAGQRSQQALQADQWRFQHQMAAKGAKPAPPAASEEQYEHPTGDAPAEEQPQH